MISTAKAEPNAMAKTCLVNALFIVDFLRVSAPFLNWGCWLNATPPGDVIRKLFRMPKFNQQWQLYFLERY